jgi:hypothetical protein
VAAHGYWVTATVSLERRIVIVFDLVRDKLIGSSRFVGTAVADKENDEGFL